MLGKGGAPAAAGEPNGGAASHGGGRRSIAIAVVASRIRGRRLGHTADAGTRVAIARWRSLSGRRIGGAPGGSELAAMSVVEGVGANGSARCRAPRAWLAEGHGRRQMPVRPRGAAKSWEHRSTETESCWEPGYRSVARLRCPNLRGAGWRRRIAAVVDADIDSIANARQHGDDQQRLQRVHKFVLPDDTSEELDNEQIEMGKPRSDYVLASSASIVRSQGDRRFDNVPGANRMRTGQSTPDQEVSQFRQAFCSPQPRCFQ